MELFGKININFAKYRYICIACSLAIIIAGIISVGIKGMVLGVDFRGGVLMEIAFDKLPEVSEVRSALKAINLEESTIQQVVNRKSIILRLKEEKVVKEKGGNTYEKLSEQIREALENKFEKNKIRFERVEFVGPLVGKDLKRKAFLATIFSWLAIILYLSFRFEFKYGLAAVIALVHDVLITLSFFSFFSKEFNLTILAAILTLIGFSVNDTIVIFDRIRENLHLYPKEQYSLLVNRSINETLSRTILTTLTTLFSVIVLFLFGGPVIHDFAFALVVGFITGSYSTIYIAAPILIDWEKFISKSR